MGRNMNLLLDAAAAAAVVLPGGAAAPAMSNADQGPVPSPAVFNECTQLALDPGDEGVIDTDVSVVAAAGDDDPVPGSGNISVERGIIWDGPLVTQDGTVCPGDVRLGSRLERRARGFTQRLTGRIALSVHAGFPEGRNAPSITAATRNISFERICAAATGAHRSAKAKVVAVDRRTYSAPGYPSVSDTQRTVLASEKCPPAEG